MELQEEERKQWKKLSSSHKGKTSCCLFHVHIQIAIMCHAFSKPENRQKSNSIQNKSCLFKSDSSKL